MLFKAAFFFLLYTVFFYSLLECKHGLIISFKNRFITQCDVTVSVKIPFFSGKGRMSKRRINFVFLCTLYLHCDQFENSGHH